MGYHMGGQPPFDPKKTPETAHDVPSNHLAVGCLLLIVGFIVIGLVFTLATRLG